MRQKTSPKIGNWWYKYKLSETYLVCLILLALLAFVANPVLGETQFIEAEDFVLSSAGWKVVQQKKGASKLTALYGAKGDPKGTAQTTITVPKAGTYRVWVRYLEMKGRAGPFQLEILRDDTVLGGQTFDLEEREGLRRAGFYWDSFTVKLPAGPVTLRLSKHEDKNCSGYLRFVDCVALTGEKDKAPNHMDYGAQTYMRVTLGDIYEKPVYIHIFADHFYSPWYSHYNLSKAGTRNGLQPKNNEKLKGGEQTPWCNISQMLYQDSGAILSITIRHSYHQSPKRMKATFEFATAPRDDAVVRTMVVEAEPNGLIVAIPPDLNTEENRSRLKRDLEFAMETGKIADNYAWPTIGRKPTKFPFFVSARIGGYGTPPDQSVIDRERKTLDYFGFHNWSKAELYGGTWKNIDTHLYRPDMPTIEAIAAKRAKELKDKGKTAEDAVFCMVMDEPKGYHLSLLVDDELYREAFQNWLKEKDLTPQALLVSDWEAVKIVTMDQRETFPALYYYSQRFRTQSLGDFMAVQRRALEEAVGGSVPVLANFSDGAVYSANFYAQGVDYFELLDDVDGQNAIWGEDWANGSSSYQCGAYNVDLMRAAARDQGQVIGHYLISYAGRKPLDVKLKAAGEAARGVKIFESFSYGVYWGTHEGGPSWGSSCWQARPETWGPYAEIMREIGGAEDLLVPAMPPPAQVAILYSSSSDIWQVTETSAYGFDRMHTWMALAHAQIPVDFLSEAQVAAGALEGYQVCYLVGPNLTRDAAKKLAAWVKQGGVLSVSAGAATRDEYNRPLPTITKLLPAKREDVATFQSVKTSGRYLGRLKPKDTVTAAKGSIKVVAVKQNLTPRATAEVIGKYSDGSPAWVHGTVGKGYVYVAGYLPGLDYIRQALVARWALMKEDMAAKQAKIDGLDATGKVTPVNSKISVADLARLNNSVNPWEYPADVRELILAPVRAAKVDAPVRCNMPLVDAVYMTCKKGIVIPLANYTLYPLPEIELKIKVNRPIQHIETVHQGKLKYRLEKGRAIIRLPLASTDYVKIYYRPATKKEQ